MELILEAGRDDPEIRSLGCDAYFKGSREEPIGDEIMVLMGGFARVASQEKVLFAIAESLSKSAVIMDWRGLGLSQGDFSGVTVKKLCQDLEKLVFYLTSVGFRKFHFLGHSFGACAAAAALHQPGEHEVGKLIFLAPALNQTYLLRYWFAKENGFDLKYMDWCEYNACLEELQDSERESEALAYWPHEAEFQKFCGGGRRVKNINIKPDYWQTESKANYNIFLPNFARDGKIYSPDILCIWGDQDQTIPYELIDEDFQKFISIEGANHYFAGREESVAELVDRFIS